MSVVFAFLSGVVVIRLLILAMRSALQVPALRRLNYRGRPTLTAGGVLVILTVIFLTAIRAGFDAFDIVIGIDGTEILIALAVTGFGLLGLWDDLVGTTETTGFRGHVRSLMRGSLTTGAVKMFGGAALAMVLVATRSHGWQFLCDAALIALCANLANLFDRRPGRVIKIALVAYVPLVIIGGGGLLAVAIAPVMGAAAGFLPEDLRERIMLGDTGANILGGVLGVGVVYFCGSTTRLVVLAVVLAFNVASEFVSFSRVIDAVAPLRAIDRLGQHRDNAA